MGRKRKVSDEDFIRVARGNPRSIIVDILDISRRTVDRYAKRLGIEPAPDMKGRRRDWDRLTGFQHRTLYLRKRILEVTGKDRITQLSRREATQAIREILGCCHDTAIKWHNFLLLLHYRQ